MDCVTLLERARSAGLDVSTQDGQLIVQGGDAALAKQLLAHKAELLPMLEAQPDEHELAKLPMQAGPVLVCMADVESRPITWLWQNRIAAGRISLLVGVPGAGKSFLTCDMAARISTGTPWPDGSPCSKGAVIIISAEDDPHNTIRPRLDAHRTDVSRIHLLSAVRYLNDKGKPAEMMFTLADVISLEDAIQQVDDCKLIVVDPVGSFLGGRTDAHRDNEVRSVLAPVAKLAEKYGPAVLVVAHRRKSGGTVADDTALGSRAFTGIARSVWHLSRDSDSEHRRLLLPGKNNLAAEQPGLAFSIVGEPGAVAWEREPVYMTADQALAQENGQAGKTSALDEAEAWLCDFLADGPKAGKEVKDAAKADGIAPRTLERAKTKLKVVAAPDGFRGPWVWRLPDSASVRQDSSESAKGESLANSGETGADCEDSGQSDDLGTCDECGLHLQGDPTNDGYMNRTCPGCGKHFRCVQAG